MGTKSCCSCSLHPEPLLPALGRAGMGPMVQLILFPTPNSRVSLPILSLAGVC